MNMYYTAIKAFNYNIPANQQCIYHCWQAGRGKKEALLVLSLRNLSCFLYAFSIILSNLGGFQLVSILKTSSVKKKQGQAFLCLKTNLFSIKYAIPLT